MSIKCILFDLDGTLANTLGDIAVNLNRALAKNSFPTHDEKKVISFINNGAVRLVKSAMPKEHTEEEFLSTFNDYQNFYLNNLVEKTYLYDGIEELIKNLKSEGFLLGVVTNKPDTHAQPIVSHFFKNTFDYVCGSKEGYAKKPDADVIKRAANALNCDISQMVLVGDSSVDVQTAKNAGIISIGVLYGFAQEQSFKDISPDHTAECAEDILKIIKKLR